MCGAITDQGCASAIEVRRISDAGRAFDIGAVVGCERSAAALAIRGFNKTRRPTGPGAKQAVRRRFFAR